MDKNELVDEIVKYHMNPDKCLNKSKEKIEDIIRKINSLLLDKKDIEEETEVILKTILTKYTGDDLNAPINTEIYKMRADEQGIAATKDYKEIYFNEIIQNANDNTNGEKIDIILSKKDAEYELSFLYEDEGFSIENIIGFLNTEIHTKRNNLSATGKHGVGIKSLFYFVNYMEIESNVKIIFDIKIIKEDEQEKIEAVKSSIEINNDWNIKQTCFKIRFPKKDEVLINVKKLIKFIELCLEGNNDDANIEKYFFGLDQKYLIFDVRSLLFTNKNKDKTNGIKKISFYKDSIEEELFNISCSDENVFINSENKVCKSVIKYNENKKGTYLLFTIEGGEREQNFSVAFPEELEENNRRYYETYYLPEADEIGINILINSKYSNVSRTKLTNSDSDKDQIHKYIDEKLIEVYSFMTNEECAKSSLYREISDIFHLMLAIDTKFIDICFNNNIDNRYLSKLEENNDGEKYIAYKRKDKEEFDKRIIGQTIKREEIIDFFNEYIVKDDCIEYDKNLFSKKVAKIYDFALNNNEKFKLRSILNLAGKVKELIYYRITGNFSDNDNISISDLQVDDWSKKIWKDTNDSKYIEISHSLIGKYKLNENLNGTGKIIGASFYEYLFNDVNKNEIEICEYQTLQKKQRELFDKEYVEMKKKLLESTICKNNNKIDLIYSSHHRASNIYYKYGDIDLKTDKYENSDEFGMKLFKLFIKTLINNKSIMDNIKKIYGKIICVPKGYPKKLWLEPQKESVSLSDDYKKIFTCLLINLDFINNIYAHDFESFKFYVENFFENIVSDNLDKFEKVHLKTYKDEKILVKLDIKEITDVFDFFYTNNRYEKLITQNYKIDFKIEFYGKLENNLCQEDLYKFLYNLMGKKIFILQTTRVNLKQEILYCYENKIKLLSNSSNFIEVGENFQIDSEASLNQDEIIIIHNDKLDLIKAVEIVLKDILGKDDNIEKFKAYISKDRKLAIQGEEYNNLNGFKGSVNKGRSNKNLSCYSSNLSCEVMKRIIIARGNNDNKCCCCGGKNIKSKLIITENTNTETKEKYPEVIEVVCNQCEQVLRKSLKNSEIIMKNSSYYAVYRCLVSNSHQKKEITYETEIYDGILSLCRKK